MKKYIVALFFSLVSLPVLAGTQLSAPVYIQNAGDDTYAVEDSRGFYNTIYCQNCLGVNTANGATATATCTQSALQQFVPNAPTRIAIEARGQTVTANNQDAYIIVWWHYEGSISAVPVIIAQSGTQFGIGSGTENVSITNIGTNGTSFHVNVANTTGDTIIYNIRCMPI